MWYESSRPDTGGLGPNYEFLNYSTTTLARLLTLSNDINQRKFALVLLWKCFSNSRLLMVDLWDVCGPWWDHDIAWLFQAMPMLNVSVAQHSPFPLSNPRNANVLFHFTFWVVSKGYPCLMLDMVMSPCQPLRLRTISLVASRPERHNILGI